MIGKKSSSVDKVRMNKSDIEEIVISKIGDQFRLRHDEISLSMNFIEDLRGDSLDTIELIMGMEHEFGFNINDEEAEALLTVQSVVDYISKRIGESQ